MHKSIFFIKAGINNVCVAGMESCDTLWMHYVLWLEMPGGAFSVELYFSHLFILLHFSAFCILIKFKDNTHYYPQKGIYTYIHTCTIERHLSGRRLSGLSKYPDQSDVLLCFFPAFFEFLPAKIYLFPHILWRRLKKWFFFI